jgi:4-hydroxybenzoate polyprenyltransferase
MSTTLTLQQRLGYYAELIRINRPIGIYLLLWPTLWALWIAAEGVPSLGILVVFVLGVTLMRSAGCAINDYADRHLDKHVKRTQQRPLTAGHISAKEAIAVFIALAFIAFLLVLQLNLATILLSTGALLLAASYPFMKRYHALPQVHLGAAFAWAIPMAFTAINGEAPPLAAWLLFFATLLWTVAYDTYYAMVDRDDDIKVGIKSSAILFGNYDRTIILLCQGIMLILLLGLGVLLQLGISFYFSLIVVAGLFAWQHYITKDYQREQCLQAFLNNNWVGLVIFVGIGLNYL